MQIKHLLQGLLSNIVVLYAALEMAFSTNLYCYIRGYVYSEGNGVTLERSDGCHTIKDGHTKDQIVLHDDVYWVIMNMPSGMKGYTPFWYKWGSGHFYINGNPHDVEWGYVLRG